MTVSAIGMPCPNCKVSLVMSERQGIEIDYCPQCRGVWLDRGELDKIIERSKAEDAVMVQPQQTRDTSSQAYNPKYEKHHQSDHNYGYRKRKKSFWEDLFD